LGRWVVENELREIDQIVATILGLEASTPYPAKDFKFFETQKEAKKWIRENKDRVENAKIYPAEVLAVKYGISLNEVEQYEVGVEFVPLF